ncbi:helix-turn-helix domain-containing protein [Planctomycetales bacterium ZRK34]|nr:helix-turn-helix domain-containing protein [Planctomycetales bacterium ZRK34]
MAVICENSKSSPQKGGTSRPTAMLTAADVAAMLACSMKTVYRLVDRGAIPRPLRVGGMLRWNRTHVEQWIADGCPPRSSQNSGG